MKLGIKHIVFAMLILSVFISGDFWPVYGANPVVVDGDRLTVHTEGMPLGELLTVIENMTGIQFTFDELPAAKKIFLDFNGLALSEGIKKIVRPLSFAAIYDGTGKLRKVIILGRWKGSGMTEPLEETTGSAQAPRVDLRDSLSFPPKRDSNSSGESKGPPPGKGPIYPDGPPVDTVHSGDGPTNKEDEIPEDLPVPSVAGSVHLPIPDSEGAVMEVPPVDKASPEGGPPNIQDEILDDVPVPGVAASDHLPIPDSEGTPVGSPPGAGSF